MSGQTCSVNLGWYREFTSSLLGARFLFLKLGGFQNGSTFKRAKAKALELIEEAKELKGLNDVRVAYLEKGPITEVLRGMGKLSAEERPRMGALVNEVREAIQTRLDDKISNLEKAVIEAKLATETIDVTLPGRPVETGCHHPLTAVVEQIEDVFIGMGYEVAEGTEVEKDYYNFEALNLPKDHPARDMQDTFYITEETLLRTHTSSVQARTMENNKEKYQLKLFVLVKCIAVMTTMRRIHISSCKLKVL